MTVKQVIEGEFNGKLICLTNSKYTLRVTNEHMMLYTDSKESEIFIKSAKNVTIGDVFLTKDGKFAVKSVEDIVIKNR